jgi:hypothetical protein
MLERLEPAAIAPIRLVILGVSIRLLCFDAASRVLVLGNFSAFVTEDEPTATLTFEIRPQADVYAISSPHRAPEICHDSYELIYYLEKALTIDVQMQRQDLFFLHGAALSRGPHAYLFVAPPGSGKSTTTWGLVHHGFSYLSDEMAPIDLGSLEVQPYPHAICLKNPPPAPYELPGAAIRTSRTIHVPATSIASITHHPVRLRSIFFNRYDEHASEPNARPISKGEAAALLYANALNQLSHSHAGLTAVASIAERVECFQITTSDLTATCRLLTAVAQDH